MKIKVSHGSFYKEVLIITDDAKTALKSGLMDSSQQERFGKMLREAACQLYHSPLACPYCGALATESMTPKPDGGA